MDLELVQSLSAFLAAQATSMEEVNSTLVTWYNTVDYAQQHRQTSINLCYIRMHVDFFSNIRHQ